jgi:hypothetical protein
MSMNYGPETFDYIIQPEDTLWDLADELNVSVEDIMEVNANLDPNNLYVGQLIYLPYYLPMETLQRRPEFERRPEFGRRPYEFEPRRRRRFRRFPYGYERRPYYPHY